jgi:hypothetical protein
VIESRNLTNPSRPPIALTARPLAFALIVSPLNSNVTLMLPPSLSSLYWADTP